MSGFEDNAKDVFDFAYQVRIGKNITQRAENRMLEFGTKYRNYHELPGAT